VTLVLRRWRTLLAFFVLGCAVALAYRGDWAWAAGAAVIALLRLAGLVLGELAEDWETARASWRPATGRHRKPERDAAGVQRSYICSGCGEPGITTWDSEEAAAMAGLRGLDLKCDRCLIGALRRVAAFGGAGIRG
jgi:hypothetical protein